MAALFLSYIYSVPYDIYACNDYPKKLQ